MGTAETGLIYIQSGFALLCFVIYFFKLVLYIFHTDSYIRIPKTFNYSLILSKQAAA